MFIEILLILLASAVFGAVFGSFANVVAIRTHDESSLWGRSHCVECKTPLKIRHLVPVLSWLIQKGKCETCGKRIHIQYPLVELAGALLAIITVARYMSVPLEIAWPWILFEFFFGLALLIFLVMDARWMELPIEMMVGAGVIFTVWNMLLRVVSGEPAAEVAWSHIVGFAVVACFFLLQWVVSRRRWIGSGDIWLGAVIGAVLGWPVVGIAIYFAYIFGGSAALVLLLIGKLKPGTRVPFAPALAAGALAAIWWAPWLMVWLSYAFA
ncbi:MAG: prepilin peptidase [Patescibacteria group bacterium]|jgi:leader peptidase (prepilin peptidase)/N-methyltransferase